ncbi:hypothetical protein DVA76_19180, partial [Acinetobacter baumannii]
SFSLYFAAERQIKATKKSLNISHGDDDCDEGGHGTFFGGVNHLHEQWVLNVNVLPVGDYVLSLATIPGIEKSWCSLITYSLE